MTSQSENAMPMQRHRKTDKNRCTHIQSDTQPKHIMPPAPSIGCVEA